MIKQHPTHDLRIDTANGDILYGGLTLFNTDTGRYYITLNFRPVDRSLLVVEAALGRELMDGEYVHHINGNTTVDGINNLEVHDWPEQQPEVVRSVPSPESQGFSGPSRRGIWS